MRSVKPPKTESPPMFVATKANVADDVIEVVDDNMAPGSNKESGSERDHKKETPAQSKFRTS